MHNIGRGMWRRVGDYERGQNSSIKMYNDMILEKKKHMIQRQIAINMYRQEMLRKANGLQINTTLEPMEIEVQKDNIIIEEKIENSNIEASKFCSIIDNDIVLNENVVNDNTVNETVLNDTMVKLYNQDTNENILNKTKNKRKGKNK